MSKAFFTAGAIQVFILLVATVLTGGIAAKMSTRHAENALLIFGSIDVVVIALSIWIYQRLGAVWGGATVPMWSTFLFALIATVTGALMFLFAMVLLNR